MTYMSKNYYESLGIGKQASKDEIKKAFRALAHKYHPDKQGGDAEKFKEINEAYSVLSDDSKRAQYDQFGSTSNAYGQQGGGYSQAGGFGGGFDGFDFSQFTQGGFNNSSGGGAQFDFDLGDIFGDVFGGGRTRQQQARGRDISVDIEISFEDAIFGVERTMLLNKTSVCDNCNGSGAEKGSEMMTCTTCNGKGSLREVKRSIFGQFESVKTCEVCKGSGKIPKTKCHECKGNGVLKKQSEIKVKIPAGIENGEMIRLTGGGEAVSGGVAGDLYIKVYVKKHSLFRKEGNDLVMDLKVKLTDALLGAQYPIKTLDGEINLKIPEGVKHGQFLKIAGKGVPYAQSNSLSKRGNILVHVDVIIPEKLSKSAKAKVEELRKEGM
jgi:molecular chaperone DnaJ